MEGKGVLRVSSSRVSRSRYLLAKRKRRRRRAKAWKEKESHACLSRASLFPLPFCLAEEARETREGMEGKGLPRASSVSITFQPSGRGARDARRQGRKRSPTRLFLAFLLFPLPFSLAEGARETREGMEGKGVPRVSSSRVFCFHYLLAKQETTATPARLIVLSSCSLFFLVLRA